MVTLFQRKQYLVLVFCTFMLVCPETEAGVRSLGGRLSNSLFSFRQKTLTPSFVDVTAVVSLGDGVGSAIAQGDFTRDRYTDLVMISDQPSMRALHILAWVPGEYRFRRVRSSWNSSRYFADFSLDMLKALPPDAFVAAVAPFDANADGNLDMLICVSSQAYNHTGIVLYGNGMGGLRLGPTLPGVNPGFLILDGDNDFVSDIMFIEPDNTIAFYRNSPPGQFEYISWDPFKLMEHRTTFNNFKDINNGLEFYATGCNPLSDRNSNAFVDMNGDCLPDLVIATENCGLHVWLNRPKLKQAIDEPLKGDHATQRRGFWNFSFEIDFEYFTSLDSSVWSKQRGDDRAIFADFNGDGTTDIAVPNSQHSRIYMSLNDQKMRWFGELCKADLAWKLRTHVALSNVDIVDTSLGPASVPGEIHVGDFNYDGIKDILLINADSGILELYEGIPVTDADNFDKQRWKSIPSKLRAQAGWFRPIQAYKAIVRFVPVVDHPVLAELEDPVAAGFFDVDETGRQDILVSQQHGTRLIRNNRKEQERLEFFKVTGTQAVPRTSMEQYFVPIPGCTVKISFDGPFGREQQVCTQCPQTGIFSLQSCSCTFGVRHIANYIEEMEVRTDFGISSWRSLVPNVVAIARHSVDTGTRWHVKYFTRSSTEQMIRVIVVFGSTLICLAVAISYLYATESSQKTKRETQSHLFFR